MVVEFLRLEKVEFGGVRGRALSELVLQLFNEFTELMNGFQSGGHNPLNINDAVSGKRWKISCIQ